MPKRRYLHFVLRARVCVCVRGGRQDLILARRVKMDNGNNSFATVDSGVVVVVCAFVSVSCPQLKRAINQTHIFRLLIAHGQRCSTFLPATE